MPLACQCVIQNHWLYHPGLRRVFYLYRDGRDVVVSHYFFLLRRIQRNPRGRFERPKPSALHRTGHGPSHQPLRSLVA
jgi:hypothetical protein